MFGELLCSVKGAVACVSRGTNGLPWVWSSRWKHDRVTLAIQTDNMGALSMVAKMQPHSARLGLIAREMAMDICAASYTPDVVRHIPGLSNKAADLLSRRHQPGKQTVLPGYLPAHLEQQPTPRPMSWWRTLPATP